MAKIIICENTGFGSTHGEAIKSAILSTYTELNSNDVEVLEGSFPTIATNYIESNSDCRAVVRSYAGISSYVNTALDWYRNKDVLLFMPMGSNSFVDVNVFQENEPTIIVSSGAGDTEGRNNTGYGKGLEFWDDDLDNNQQPDLSSFSNGVICAKLLKIKETLNCSWWEARYRARITAERTESNRQTSFWDLYNGYGKINVNNAIAYTGFIPGDIYIEDEEPEIVYWNTEQTYTKEADEGYTGESITKVVSANTIGSLVSQEEANNLALQLAEYLANEEFTQTAKNILGIEKYTDTIYGAGGLVSIKKLELKENKLYLDSGIYLNLDALNNDKTQLELVKHYFNITNEIKRLIYIELNKQILGTIVYES